MADKKRAARNRTIVLADDDVVKYSKRLVRLSEPVELKDILNRTINQDIFEVLPFLPDSFVDLMIIDPPYNLNKDFNGRRFTSMSVDQYSEWVDKWLSQLIRLLKPTATVYICSDWRSSTSVHIVASKYLKIRNRITWEREKGRGALRNWKNTSEDIWFCTFSDKYTFNVDSVKLRRRVIAPYTLDNSTPKGWDRTEAGNFRLTYPSNLWTDITVPFWSMPENTDHPTQKPEKLIAKLILASSNPGDIVFDPFLGSGTTSVVAKKLGRHYVGIEIDKAYSCLAEKRLEMAESDAYIQGYSDGVFWERNTLQNLKRSRGNGRRGKTGQQMYLFESGQKGRSGK